MRSGSNLEVVTEVSGFFKGWSTPIPTLSKWGPLRARTMGGYSLFIFEIADFPVEQCEVAPIWRVCVSVALSLKDLLHSVPNLGLECRRNLHSPTHLLAHVVRVHCQYLKVEEPRTP